MTRGQAINRIMIASARYDELGAGVLVDVLAALEIIKVDAPADPINLTEAHWDTGLGGRVNVRVERWPEGIVVWCAGRIRYKSWEDE